MNKPFIDIKFLKDVAKGYADIAYDSNGDLIADNSFDTTIQLSIGTDSRADDNEIARKEFQRGSIMDLFNIYSNGSKLWLLEQARKVPQTKNKAIAYVQNCLKFLIEDGFVKNIVVDGAIKQNGIELYITFELFSGVFDNYHYKVWNNSIYKT